MRLKGLGILVVLIIALAVPTGLQAGRKKVSEIPFAMELSTFKVDSTQGSGPGIRATIINISNSDQLLLVDSNVQPIVLFIFDSKNRVVSSEDTRANKKYDNTPYYHLFRKLQPKEKLVGEIHIPVRNIKGTFDLEWPPLFFHQLPKGKYRAYAEWRSEQETWGENADDQIVIGRWKGILRSNEITFILE